MFHLFKADLYQLRHRKGPFIFVGFTLILTVLITWGITRVSLEGEFVNVNFLGNTLTNGFSATMHSMLMILALLGQMISFNNDKRNRTLINTVSFGYQRSTIFIEKVILGTLYSSLTLILIFASFILSASLAGVRFATPDIISTLWSFILPSITLIFAYTSYFVIIAFLTTSNGLLFLSYFVLSNLNLAIDAFYAWLNRDNPEAVTQIVQGAVGISNGETIPFGWVLTKLSYRFPVRLFGLTNVDWMPILAILYGVAFCYIGIYLFRRSEVK